MSQDVEKTPQVEDRLLWVAAALLFFATTKSVIFPKLARLWKRLAFLRYYHLKFVVSLLFLFTMALVLGWIWNKFVQYRSQKAILSKDKTSVRLGVDVESGEEIHLKETFRTAHIQVIGTTNAGKTASVIMPLIAQDIEQGRGMIIIDGKADGEFLNQLHSYAIKNNRENDFYVFSIANPYLSSTYNPLCDGTATQIADRVFGAFNITDAYYRGVQYSSLRTVISLLKARGERPVPGVVRELLRDRKRLEGWLDGLQNPNLRRDVAALVAQNDDEFHRNHSGLISNLDVFCQDAVGRLFNTTRPEINLSDAIKQRKICYFQLPTMLYPYLGEFTGKLLLQNLQSVISEIQVGGQKPGTLFSIYLDDFNDYIYPGFVSLLNKSRSANVSVVFSHQSLGDLDKLGPEFKQIVVTNTNIKFIMRSNDPDSADHFANIIGTRTTEKTTNRRKKGFFRDQDTGEQSVRETEEFLIHPNVIKRILGQGAGIAVIPHPGGTEVRSIRFSTVPLLSPIAMPLRDLPEMDFDRESKYFGIKTETATTTKISTKGEDLKKVMSKSNQNREV